MGVLNPPATFTILGQDKSRLSLPSNIVPHFPAVVNQAPTDSAADFQLAGGDRYLTTGADTCVEWRQCPRPPVHHNDRGRCIETVGRRPGCLGFKRARDHRSDRRLHHVASVAESLRPNSGWPGASREQHQDQGRAWY